MMIVCAAAACCLCLPQRGRFFCELDTGANDAVPVGGLGLSLFVRACANLFEFWRPVLPARMKRSSIQDKW